MRAVWRRLFEKKLGVKVQGVLHYPLLKRTVKVELTEEREKEIESVLEEMKNYFYLEVLNYIKKLHV